MKVVNVEHMTQVVQATEASQILPVLIKPTVRGLFVAHLRQFKHLTCIVELPCRQTD